MKTLPKFEKKLKKLDKKYPSLKAAFIALVNTLKDNPELDTPLGNVVGMSNSHLRPF